jgi:hypothetical protein
VKGFVIPIWCHEGLRRITLCERVFVVVYTPWRFAPLQPHASCRNAISAVPMPALLWNEFYFRSTEMASRKVLCACHVTQCWLLILIEAALDWCYSAVVAIRILSEVGNGISRTVSCEELQQLQVCASFGSHALFCCSKNTRTGRSLGFMPYPVFARGLWPWSSVTSFCTHCSYV